MFCPKCGTQNPDGSKFCAGCGAPLARPAANPATPSGAGVAGAHSAPAYGAPVAGAPAVPKPKKKVAPIAIAAVAVVAVVAVVAFVVVPALFPKHFCGRIQLNAKYSSESYGDKYYDGIDAYMDKDGNIDIDVDGWSYTSSITGTVTSVEEVDDSYVYDLEPTGELKEYIDSQEGVSEYSAKLIAPKGATPSNPYGRWGFVAQYRIDGRPIMISGIFDYGEDGSYSVSYNSGNNRNSADGDYTESGDDWSVLDWCNPLSDSYSPADSYSGQWTAVEGEDGKVSIVDPTNTSTDSSYSYTYYLTMTDD